MVQPLIPIPLPKANVYSAIEALFRQVDGVKEMLTNPTLSTIRLVLNPEKMVIKEAQRALTYLNLYGYITDAIVSNRIFPAELQRGYLAEWSFVQKRYREAIQRAFLPLPIWEVPLFDREVVGLPMLRKMGEALFGEKDPTKVHFSGQVQTIRKRGKQYTLSLKLPFARKEEIGLIKHGDELIITIGNFRRDIILPRALAILEVERATLEDGVLVVRFTEVKDQGGKKDG